MFSGCAGAPTAGTPSGQATESNTTSPTSPNATTPVTAMGPRGDLVTEHFVLTADHALTFVEPNTKEVPPTSIPESFTGVAFFTSGDMAGTMKPWVGPSAQRTFEVFGDVPITLRFTSAQPAASITKGIQFPPVGGWFGTKERWAVYFTATDAPDTIEAGKTYTVHMTAKMPPAGFFLRAGEALALHTYLGYQTADNAPPSYVVGGHDPAGFTLPHVHFNITAPNATVILDKTGALAPNPAQTTAQDQQPTDLAFEVPPGTLYLVADVAGTPTGGGTIDVDLALRAGSDVLGAGVGPSAHEVVELGPMALAKAGGRLTAHVAGATPTGGSFKLTITAFGP